MGGGGEVGERGIGGRRSASLDRGRVVNEWSGKDSGGNEFPGWVCA